MRRRWTRCSPLAWAPLLTLCADVKTADRRWSGTPHVSGATVLEPVQGSRREDHDAVRPDRDAAALLAPVQGRAIGVEIERVVAAELLGIGGRVGVEPHVPAAGARGTRSGASSSVRSAKFATTTVSSCGPPSIPAVQREDLRLRIGTEDRDVGAPQAARRAIAVAAQGDEVPVERGGAPVACSPSPVERDRIVEPRSSRAPGPGTASGCPGDVRTSAEPSAARFLDHQLSASPGEISSGTRALAVGDLVVRLGVDDPLSGAPRPSPTIAATTASTSRASSSSRPRARAGPGRRTPASHWAPNPAPPSAVGVTIDGSSSMSSAIVIFQGWRVRDLVVEPGHERPAIRERGAGSVRPPVDGPDVDGGIEAEAVDRNSSSHGHRAVAQERRGPRRGRSPAASRPTA